MGKYTRIKVEDCWNGGKRKCRKSRGKKLRTIFDL